MESSCAQCYGIQDSLGFWIPRREFQIPGTGFQSFSVELGFWIPILGFGIPKSRIQYFTSKTFPGFRIPQAKIYRIAESRFP